MIQLWNEKLSKMILILIFSIGTRSKNSCINDRHIVFISRWEKIADNEPKESGQSCKEQFHLNDFFLQITWCFYVKQKYGKATDLSIATYESVFD